MAVFASHRLCGLRVDFFTVSSVGLAGIIFLGNSAGSRFGFPRLRTLSARERGADRKQTENYKDSDNSRLFH
jgi:hypothetical protein